MMANQPNPNWGAHGNGGYPVSGYLPSNPFVHTATSVPGSASSMVDCLLPSGAEVKAYGDVHRSGNQQPGGRPAIRILKAVVDRDHSVGRGFGRVFELAERYVISKIGIAPQTHNSRPEQIPRLQDIGMFPNPLLNGKLDHPLVRDAIVATAPSVQAAHSMMGDYQLRILLVTKLLVLYLIDHVLIKRCFDALAYAPWKSEAAYNITDFVWELNNNTPSNIRYQALKRVGEEMRKLRGLTQLPNGTTIPRILPDLNMQRWFNQRAIRSNGIPAGITNRRGDEFWPFVMALTQKKKTQDWNDMQELMAEAHMHVFDMYDTPCEYGWDWPKIGEAFDPERMVVRASLWDRYGNFKGTEGTSLKGRKVDFVVSPGVEVRQFKASGFYDGKRIVKAQVLVRSPLKG